jgi:hypothetical protein
MYTLRDVVDPHRYVKIDFFKDGDVRTMFVETSAQVDTATSIVTEDTYEVGGESPRFERHTYETHDDESTPPSPVGDALLDAMDGREVSEELEATLGDPDRFTLRNLRDAYTIIDTIETGEWSPEEANPGSSETVLRGGLARYDTLPVGNWARYSAPPSDQQ